MQMAVKGIQGDKRVWPSLDIANKIYNVATLTFIATLVVGIVATVLIAWMSGVKEHYWDISRTNSEEKIAELNSTAESEKLARIKIELRLADRKLNTDQIDEFKASMIGFSSSNGLRQLIAIFPYPEVNFESQYLTNQLLDIFQDLKFAINANRVTYGKFYVVSGIGILVNNSDQSKLFGEALGPVVN